MLVIWCFQKASPLRIAINVFQNTVVSIEARKCLTDYATLQSFLFVPAVKHAQNVPSLVPSSIAGKSEAESKQYSKKAT